MVTVIDVGALELHHPDGQVFTFEPGSLALAFAVTGPGTHEGPLAVFQTLGSAVRSRALGWGRRGGGWAAGD